MDTDYPRAEDISPEDVAKQIGRVSVVLPAAGVGLRASTPTPKQYWPIESKPLIYYTLATLQSIKWITEVVVIVAADLVEDMSTKAAGWGFEKLRFVPGASTRHRSIRLGIQAIHPDTSTVIIHDAVRPFVDEQALLSVSYAAYAHGAAGTIIPLVSTVIKADENGFMTESLDRTKYRASQTPQAFQRAIIQRAYNQCTNYDLDFGTECLHLAQTYGKCKVKLVEGVASNLWKVTHQHDLFAAEQMVKRKLRQVALVTGGSRGIGKATAVALANRGFKVAILARGEEDLSAVAQDINGLAVVADVSNPDQVRNAFETVKKALGSIDVCVNNAGQSVVETSIADTEDVSIQQIIDCNLTGTFYCCREAVRHMQTGGSGGVIVNVGSSSADGGRVGQGVYSMSKAGIHNLTETLAQEGRAKGILTYCVAPIRTATDLRRQIVPTENDALCLTPARVADAIVSVVMDANPHLSGQSFWLRHPEAN